MNSQSQTNTIASTLLGKRIEISDSYSPSMLVAVPRQENRNKYNIDADNLPFEGYDVWHCYEFSSMTNQGLPVTRVLKLRYNCDSDFIIESKSLKLYLNSYNMSNFGDSVEDCLHICKKNIEKDLSEKLETNVVAEFLPLNPKRINIFSGYKNIVDDVDISELRVKSFSESPEVLKISELNSLNEYFLTFDSLRSNCRVTHQPDFGDVFIYYRSKKMINKMSLLEYLISFRGEYHFHEECCEMIFKRLYDLLDKDDELMVCALYTRRGGIDISPVRYTKGFNSSDIDALLDLSVFSRYGIKQ